MLGRPFFKRRIVMIGTFEEMCLRKDFREFLNRFRDSANYFVAAQNEQQANAVNLCMAYAFKAGLGSRETGKPASPELMPPGETL